MKAEAQAEHRWLQQLVGEWTYESECVMAPGQPPGRFAGTERARMVGDLWLVAEGEGEMPGGGTGRMVVTLDTEGPCFAGDGKIGRFQDIIEIRDTGHRILTSRALGDDGAWTPFMTAHYRRRA
ncbi:MAG: DUF1579 family protein [Alphaproteobacteria bacterium]|nr:DUF1579 family protein [Alphaproteobacteria bacterium]